MDSGHQSISWTWSKSTRYVERRSATNEYDPPKYISQSNPQTVILNWENIGTNLQHQCDHDDICECSKSWALSKRYQSEQHDNTYCEGGPADRQRRVLTKTLR